MLQHNCYKYKQERYNLSISLVLASLWLPALTLSYSLLLYLSPMQLLQLAFIVMNDVIRIFNT